MSNGVLRAACVVAGLCIIAPVWADEPPKQPTLAQLHYEEGRAAREAGDWEKAEKEFAQALAAEPSPKTAGELGRAQVELKKYVEGATNLEWFFAHDKDVDPAKKEKIRPWLTTAKQFIGVLRLSIDPPDADVYIDGKRVEDRRLGDQLYVELGVHTIEARKKGFVAASRPARLTVGSDVPIELKLVPEANVVGEALPRIGPKPNGPGADKKWLIAGAAIGGTFAVASIATGIAAGVEYARFVNAYHREVCDGDCDADAARRASTVRPLMITWPILGAAAIGTGAITLWAARRKAASDARSELSFVPLPNGFVIGGRW